MMIHVVVVMQCSIEHDANRISLGKHQFIALTEQFFRRLFQCRHGRGIDGSNLAIAINGEHAGRNALKDISGQPFDFFEGPFGAVVVQEGDDRRNPDCAD